MEKEKQPIKAPILLIGFNRPENTKKVFAKIREAKPKKLYFAVDGPREENKDDYILTKEVKDIISMVDWDCNVYTRFSDINQGCGYGPYNAISWVFENEDRAIILEDDCVPALPFFSYCDELLEKYKDDTRIWLISGSNFSEKGVRTKYSYFFSKYGQTWGWATWRRCWKEMDMQMSSFPLLIKQDLLKSAFYTEKEASFFGKIFERNYYNQTTTDHIWDFQFLYTRRVNNALTIVPRKNLIRNIGYHGTHSKKQNEFHNRLIDETYKIVSHPDFLLCDINYDNYHFKNHWYKKKTILNKIIRKTIKIWKYLKS